MWHAETSPPGHVTEQLGTGEAVLEIFEEVQGVSTVNVHLGNRSTYRLRCFGNRISSIHQAGHSLK